MSCGHGFHGPFTEKRRLVSFSPCSILMTGCIGGRGGSVPPPLMMLVRAAADMAEGEEVTIAYTGRCVQV